MTKLKTTLEMPLKIVLVEDNPTDADLIVRELKRSGIYFVLEVTDTREGFESLLENFKPDIILSDYSLPGFDAISIFDIKEQKKCEVPFIIVSGVIGEEKAVEIIKTGITDYVLKDKLFTLNSKMARAVKEAKDLAERKKAEEKRKEFEHFFNNSNDLSCIANMDGYFEIVNPQFEILLGYSKEELLNTPFVSFIHPDDVSATLQELEKLKTGATSINFVNRYRKKNGDYLWFDWNSIPNPVSGKLYAIARDITERIKVEKERLEMLEFELLLSEIATTLVQVSNQYLNHAIIKSQRLICEFLHLDLSSIYQPNSKTESQLKLNYVYHRHENLVVPEVLIASEYFPWCEKELLAGNIPVVNSMNDLPVEAARDRESWNQFGIKSSVMFPLIAASGEFLGTISFDAMQAECHFSNELINRLKLIATLFANVIKRKQIEEELIESREHMALFIEHSPASLAMFDTEMRYIATSRRWLMDYNLRDQDIIGKTHYEVFPEIGQEWKDIHKRCLNGTVERREEDSFTRLDGTIDWLKWEVRPWHKVDGEIGGIIMFTEVMTEQKESELKFKNLVEKSLVGVYIIQNGKFVYVSPKFANYLDYTEEEMLNLKSSRQIVSETDLPVELEQWRKKVDAGIIEDLHIELKHLRKDGTIIWAELYCGEIFYKGTKAILGSFQDITERKNAAFKLEQSEERHRALVENISDAIVLMDANNQVIYQSPSAERITGYSYKDRTKGLTYEFVYKEDQPKVIEIFQSSINKSGVPINFQLRLNHKEGHIIWIEGTFLNLLHNESVKAFVVSYRDVTERKKAETVIKEQAETFSAIIENANESIWLLSPDLKVLNFNKTAKDRIENNGGKEIHLGDNFRDYIYENTESIFMPMFNTALEGKYIEQESCQKDINGNDFWLRTKMYPIYTAEKKLIGITVLAENISRRKKAESELEQSEEKNRALIENISDTIILMNEELEVVFQSPSYVRTAGFTMEDLSGKTVLDIIYPDDVQYGHEIILTAKASPGMAVPLQLRTLHKKGDFIWIEGTITNLLENNHVKAYVLNYRDITMRKLMETERMKIVSEMAQRNRDLEQFSYIVSHNLRSPVANIIGITDYLLSEDAALDEKQEMTEGLHTSVRALDSVINDLNVILQKKQMIDEKKEKVRLSKIFKGIKLSLAMLIEKDKIIFNCDFTQIDEMFTIKSYLHSIFYNLISNSIKYRRPEVSTVIEISSKLYEDKIVLIFKDNGLGIDLERRNEHLFGLYKRFHTHVDGKGVGLFMVKTQVETLGGKIVIHSEINKGTEFIIEFGREKDVKHRY